MSDEKNSPDEQAQDASQQQETPEGFIKKERYTGAVKKIETLTNSQKEMQSELTEKSSEIEQLSGSLAEMEATVENTKGEYSSEIEELQGKISEKENQISSLQAMKTKVDLLKEMGRPDLLPIVDHLPNVADKDQLKSALNDFASTMDNAVKTREEQLLNGVIDTPSGGGEGSKMPQTREGWVKHINQLPLGSDERKQATDQYGDWLEQS